MGGLRPLGLALCVLLAAPGCTYLTHRAEDAADMVDLGLTFTSTAQFTAYKACTPVFAIGGGKVEGRFLGLGGGQIGWMPLYHEGTGLALWGQQKIAFGKFDKNDPATLNYQRSGPLGMKNAPVAGPEYMLCCVQHLHLGWVGIVVNVRWLQMADFLAGWFGADFCHDDGTPRGSWTRWPENEESPAPAKSGDKT